MKKAIIFLSLLLSAGMVFAGGGYFSVSLSPEAILGTWNSSAGNVAEIDSGDYMTMGGSLGISAGYEFGGWFGLGVSTGAGYNGSKLDAYDGLITVPVMLEAVFAPSIGEVRIPVRLAAGGYAQFLGNTYALGPAFALSAGFLADVSSSVSIGYTVGAELFMQYAKNGDVSYQVDLMPISLVTVCRF